MFQGLQESQLSGAIEAMLFVTDEPVGVITLADMLEVDPAQVEAELVKLRDKLASEERGVQLREVAGGWRLFTHPVYHELIEKYVLSWDTRRLSQAALETLAVVAYSQPVTRGQVAAVRGVNSDSSINSLVEKGLLREAGVADAPGNPVLYATTRAFLEKFGLRSTADLPDLDQFAPDDKARAFIRERLSATRTEVAIMPDDAAQAMGAVAASEAGAGASGQPVFSEGEGTAVAKGADAAVSNEASAGSSPAVAAGVSMDAAAGAFAAAAADPDDSNGSTDFSDPDAQPGEQPSPFAAALAQGFGLVEKIDFSSLRFETDDE